MERYSHVKLAPYDVQNFTRSDFIAGLTLYMYCWINIIYVRFTNRVSPTNRTDSHNRADPTNGHGNLASSHNWVDFSDIV